MCLAQGHNPVNLFGLQPATFRGAALHKEKEIKRERQRESITGSCSEQCSRANTIKCGVEKKFENLTQQICFWQIIYSLWETLSSTGASTAITILYNRQVGDLFWIIAGMRTCTQCNALSSGTFTPSISGGLESVLHQTLQLWLDSLEHWKV